MKHLKYGDHVYAQALPILRQSIFVKQILYVERWLWQKISVQFSELKNFHVSLLLMKILFNLLAHCPWLLNHLLNCFLQSLPYSNFLFIAAVLVTISTWFFAIYAINSNSQSKRRQVWSYPFLKKEVFKHFNHDQTVANQPKLFHFDTSDTKSVLTNFDDFDHNYGSRCVFP